MLASIQNISGEHRKIVFRWLVLGLILVFVQVVIGGITRLTNSGLSITEWEIIKGTLPPLNQAEWQIAFDKYKTFASVQFQSLHADMDIEAFKKIYFWEYFHRLWARSIGFIFLFPFIFFVIKKWLSTDIIKRLGVVILMATAVATFGWIMVASGLSEDKRTWVSAYKLVIHLMLATGLFAYLLWTAFIVYKDREAIALKHPPIQALLKGLLWLTLFQIGLGGLMAGMRAGLIFPEWSIWVDLPRFISILNGQLDSVNIIDYESNAAIKAYVQLAHRFTAYLVTLGTVYYYTISKNFSSLAKSGGILFILIIIQLLLGLFTVANCIGSVPPLYGVLHQGTALIFLAVLLWNKYIVIGD